jgi:hypothetical protein
MCSAEKTTEVLHEKKHKNSGIKSWKKPCFPRVLAGDTPAGVLTESKIRLKLFL